MPELDSLVLPERMLSNGIELLTVQLYGTPVATRCCRKCNDNGDKQMEIPHATTVARVFRDWRHGQESLQELLGAGFTIDQLGILARAGDRWIWDSDSPGTEITVADPRVLWDMALAAGILPGVGPVIAGGTLASILFREMHSVRPLRLALQDAGVAANEFQSLEQAFEDGQTIVTVHSSSKASSVPSWLSELKERHNGQLAHSSW
jgi:hypothetical protein